MKKSDRIVVGDIVEVLEGKAKVRTAVGIVVGLHRTEKGEWGMNQVQVSVLSLPAISGPMGEVVENVWARIKRVRRLSPEEATAFRLMVKR